MKHLDLFSGIGGFAYAVDQVWNEKNEHIFCDNNEFCQKVLKKHWPESKIYGDIRSITDTTSTGQLRQEQPKDSRTSKSGTGKNELNEENKGIDLLTGGFPCQPFSQAGRRGGTADDRYLWPEMLRVIQLTKPTWVIAENVRGLLTINEGMVFEQVCLDLEASGYEVQPFIIPAVSVNAPHRRDRVWIVARARTDKNAPDSKYARLERKTPSIKRREKHFGHIGNSIRTRLESGNREWRKNWLEVATRLCRMDDGVPNRVYFLREIGYNMIDDRYTESPNTKAIPTLTKSAWSEMRRMWEYRESQQASYKNGGKGVHNSLLEMPYPSPQDSWFGKLGATEEEKELCGLWKDFYSAPFDQAQNLFPEMLERIRKIKRPKEVAKDRVNRLKSLGNAIVPAVAIQIMQAIKEVNYDTRR